MTTEQSTDSDGTSRAVLKRRLMLLGAAAVFGVVAFSGSAAAQSSLCDTQMAQNIKTALKNLTTFGPVVATLLFGYTFLRMSMTNDPSQKEQYAKWRNRIGIFGILGTAALGMVIEFMFSFMGVSPDSACYPDTFPIAAVPETAAATLPDLTAQVLTFIPVVA